MRGKRTPKSKKKSAKTPRRVSVPSALIKVSLSLIIILVLIATVFKISEFIVEKQKTIFPKLEISLTEAPIEQINFSGKDTKYLHNTATFTIDNDVSIFNDIEVKGRGNATWNQPKKPYQIKLNEKADIFGLNAAKKWILLANYLDPTYLRNDVALYLENLLDEPYKLNGGFIELYFDGHYNGLYYLTEKVEIKKSRVNLKNSEGILVEFDNIYGEQEGCHKDIFDNCLTISDSVNPDNEELTMQSFIDDINAVELAITKQDFETISNILDIDSFAKYYLLNEFAVNPDAYATSFFLYKDGEEDKIHAGPGWDFDIAFGHTGWTPDNVDPNLFHSPSVSNPIKTFIFNDNTGSVTNGTRISPLLYDLLDFPEFSARVREIYQETLSGHGEELLSYIRSRADYIRDAAYRDQDRWKLKTDFDEEVDYLIDWVAKRYMHFEEIYGADSNNEITEE